MRALVTGSTGFIGSHLVEVLVGEGNDVRCLVRESSHTACLNHLPVTMMTGDYEDPSSLIPAVESVDVVFHLAARIQAPDWVAYRKANTTSTENLIEACIEAATNLRRFVFVSSISAAGPSSPGCLKKESDPCQPVSLYGKSKLLAEEAVLRRKDRLPVTIVRPPNVLGAGQEELTTILKTIKSRILPMIGSDTSQTSLCFVQDLVLALKLTAKSERAVGQVYFVTDNHTYNWREMLIAIARKLNVYPYVLKIPYRLLYVLAAAMETACGPFNVIPPVTTNPRF